MEKEDWFSQFQNQGFAVIENFLTDAEVESMKRSCEEIVSELDPNAHRCIFSASSNKVQQAKDRDDYFLSSGDKVRCFYEKQAVDEDGNLLVEKHRAVNKIAHALHTLVPAFTSVTFSDKLKDVVKRFQYDDPIVMQSMYIYKQPRIGGEVGPHQDASYLYCDPLKLFGLWFAMEDTTEENGCLHFIPYSHRDGIRGNYRYVSKIENGHREMVYEGNLASYQPEQFVPVPVRKGSLIVFDGLAVHCSSANTSHKSRQAYSLHVYDGSSKWSERNWLQPSNTGNFSHMFPTKA